MKKTRLFPSARDDAERSRQQKHDSLQSRSPSFQLAFTDTRFLLREELRSVRLQLELLKPELLQQEQNIDSTVVVFGSARTLPPDKARLQLEQQQRQLAQQPDDSRLQQAVRKAQKQLEHSEYYQAAQDFARLVSENSLQQHPTEMIISTGGGPGIMEAANRGAYDVGAQSIGLTIALPREELPNPYITPELCFQFHYFAIRKMHFLMRACAMVAFPGGFGTFDELFETLTLMQTRRINPVPIILFGRRFWDRLLDFNAMVDEGVISEEDLQLFHYAESAQEAWQIIKDFQDLT